MVAPALKKASVTALLQIDTGPSCTVRVPPKLDGHWMVSFQYCRATWAVDLSYPSPSIPIPIPPMIHVVHMPGNHHGYLQQMHSSGFVESASSHGRGGHPHRSPAPMAVLTVLCSASNQCHCHCYPNKWTNMSEHDMKPEKFQDTIV